MKVCSGFSDMKNSAYYIYCLRSGHFYHLALILFDLIKFSIKLFRQYYKTELANMVRESISRISLLESPCYGMNFKIK